MRLHRASAPLVTPLVLMALTTAVEAGPLFSANFLSFDAGSGPRSVAIADLDADGRPDLAVANSGSNTVSVLLGNGDGTFGAQTDFQTGTYPASVAIADLNGDWRRDLVVANAGFYPADVGTVSVLLGNGDGTFAAQADFGIGGGSSSVAIADFNADGWPDLVVAGAGPYPDDVGRVSVLLGNGDGTFGPRTDFWIGRGSPSVAIADVNEDGGQDLVVASSDTVSVLLGDGDGTFGTRDDFDAGVRAVSMAIGDFNADGHPDLAVGNGANRPEDCGTVSVLLGNGDGTFGTKSDFGTALGLLSVAIADLNADGRPDLAAANTLSNTVSVLLGNGDGTFTPRTDVATGREPSSVAIADLNGDGRPDLAVGSESKTVSVLLGKGDGTFGTGNFATEGYPYTVAIADLNADGRMDLAVANYYLSTVSVLLGNGDGTFAAKTDFGAGSGSYSVAIADVNGDGRPDMAVANYHSSTVSVLLGNGDGTFASGSDFETGSNSRSVAIADLDGDGRPDLVVANSGSNTVSVLLGNGDGTFGAKNDFETGDLPYSVAIADLDGDGRPDLAVANHNSNTVSVLVGNGDGTFGAPTDLDAGPSPGSLAIADLDGDGRPDLAVANDDSNAVSVLLGNGGGTFTPRAEFGAGIDPRTVAIADLDGDGRLDLAVANYSSNTVSVLLGNGDGTFETKADFGTESNPRSVAIADLDGDGRLDLAVANVNLGLFDFPPPNLALVNAGSDACHSPGGTVSVLLNLGTATPAPIAMGFDLRPNTLNLTSQGLWVTGFLEPASPCAAGDIDISSIRLTETVPVDPAAPTELADHDGNGIPDLMVKFNRAALELTLSNGDQVPVTVTGTVLGDAFLGTDSIRVRRAVVLTPAAGSHLTGGGMMAVRWETPSGVVVESVALLKSLDGGATWSLVAHEQPNTGSFDWTVPNAQTDQAKVAVVLVESADETGFIVEGVLGVSEAFTIEELVALAGPGPAQFALRGVIPNPAPHELRVSFSLGDSKPATLALFDVSGRQLAARRVDEMGPGWHTVALGQGQSLPAGLYLILLTQDGQRLTTRAALVR